MTTPVVRLPDGFRRQIIDHCLGESPNEGCGLFAMDGDEVVFVYPTPNGDTSPTRYTVPPGEHLKALTHAESNGWRLGGVFHSHPTGFGAPSATDIAMALDPDWIYLVVGLIGETELRGWRIRTEKAEELRVVSVR